MNGRYKNINEEVNRIKSLFTEERLYGNIIDSKPKLLTEQIKSLRGIWDDVAKSILKNSNEFRFKAPKGMEGNPRVRVVKEKGGDIKWYRGNKEIQPTVRNLVSTPTLREIQSRMNKILRPNDLKEFLTGEDFYKIYDDIFKDLRAQEILDSTSADNLLNTFRNQNLGSKIYDDILGSNKDEFMNGIYSMSDLKSVHPSFAEMIDDIPYFEQKLKTILKKGDDFYDDDAVILARYFSGDDFYDEWSGDITAEILENQNILKVNLKSNSSLINNPSIKNNPRINLERNPNNSDEYILTLNLKSFNKKDIDLLKSNLPDSPTIAGAPKKTTRGGLEDYIDDFDDLSNLKKQKARISDEIIRKSKSSNSDVIGNWKGRFLDDAKKGIDLVLNNKSFPVFDTIKDAWSKSFRKNFNVSDWKKTGRGNNPNLDLQLTDIQKKYVDDVYTTDIPSRESNSPFIEKTDTDLLEKGYKEGMIHPNAKLKPNWKDELYETIKIIYWKKALWSVNSDYRSWSKNVGRFTKNAILFTPGPWGIPIYNIVTFLAGASARMAMSNTINKILENNGIIKLIANIYRVNCVNSLSSNINNNKDLSERTKSILLGEIDGENGSVSGALRDVFRSVGGIGNLTQSITGTPPKYSALDTTNVDEDFFTWLDVVSEDQRTINENTLTYSIKNLVNKDIGGPSWEIVEHEGDVGVKIVVDENGELCKKDTSGCKSLFFTLECGEFSKFYTKFMDTKDIKEVLLELGWDAAFAVISGQGYKDIIINKTKEIYGKMADEVMNIEPSQVIDKVKEKKEKVEKAIDDARGATTSDPENQSVLKKY